MEITTTTTDQPKRSPVLSAFALIGFIVLIIIGILLAIYSARYIPKTLSRLGSAAVSLSQTFKPKAEEPALQIVTATTSLPIGDTVASTTTEATTTASVSATTTVVTTVTKPRTSAGSPVVTTIPRNVPAALYGKPDLTVSITDIGYLDSGSDNNSFVSSTNVPNGKNGAISFVIRNIGTNESGAFTFSANIPTAPAFTFVSPTQQSLRPGDRIEYTLGFDRGDTGSARTVTILVDNNSVVDESNEVNNSQARAIDIHN